MNRSPLCIDDDVARALSEGRPAVALESTLIAHGLPWPANLDVARASEAAVRKAGAIPATIAVIGGTIRVGLTPDELERMARSVGGILKASRRDLSAAVAAGADAATTVAATLWIARSAGLGVMATGGLGGVHRGASDTFDVSADLDELARADGALVVCSGAKSILDLPATLERLETLGVPIVGYRTDTLPAFTALSSGLPLEHRVNTPADAASVLRAHRNLGLPGAIVLANPAPTDRAIDGEQMESAIAEALDDARARGVAGKALTPFLLDRVRQATAGRSLEANAALIESNAALAGAVASALATATATGA